MSNKNDPALNNNDETEEQELKEYYFNPEAGDLKKDPASVSDTLNLDSDIQNPSPYPIKPKKSKSLFKKLTFFLLIICLVGVGILIFKAYANITGQNSGADENIILEIEGPKEIISGEPTEYKIIFENKSNNIIKEAEVNVRFPKNFNALNFKPKPENIDKQKTNSIKIAQYFWLFYKVNPGAKKEIIITGQTFGEIGATQIITASSHYQPENFSSDFKISKILETEITDTLVNLEINAPTEIINNSEIEYLIKINPSLKTSATTTLKDLPVYIEYPLGFDAQNIETEIEEHSFAEAPPNTNASWLIKDLDQEKTIKITGTISGNASEYKELLVKVGYYSDDEFYLQAGESFITIIIKPELALNLRINNLETESLNVDWRDEVEYSLIAKNQGEIELSDIILKLSFSGNDIIDWLNVACEKHEDCDFLLTTSNNGSTKILVWTRDQLSDLESLAPDKSAIVKLKLNLKDEPATQAENYHVKVSAQADVKLPGLKDSLIIQSNEIVQKIKTKTDLKTEARYFTDEYLKIGSGPLPPLVGAATSFRIFWEITNTSNAVKDIEVTTTLPDNVSFTNKTQAFAGALKYSSYNRQITWTIPQILAYPSNPIRANFEISVTPKISQIGEYLTLIQETTLKATDDYTGEGVTAYVGYLTSELENDLAAQGKGRVE